MKYLCIYDIASDSKLICIVYVVIILCPGHFLVFVLCKFGFLKGVCSLTTVNIVQQGHYAHYFDKLCIYDMEETSGVGEECRVSILK